MADGSLLGRDALTQIAKMLREHNAAYQNPDTHRGRWHEHTQPSQSGSQLLRFTVDSYDCETGIATVTQRTPHGWTGGCGDAPGTDSYGYIEVLDDCKFNRYPVDRLIGATGWAVRFPACGTGYDAEPAAWIVLDVCVDEGC